MIEEGAAESALEEIVGQRVLPRQPPQPGARTVAMAEGESPGVGPGHELVVPATVDLLLVGVEAMDEVAGLLVGRHEAADIEGLVGQVFGKARVAGGRRQPGVEHRRQCLIRLARLVELNRRRAGVGEAGGAGKAAEQGVETPVFQIDHQNVVDPAQGRSLPGLSRAAGQSRSRQQRAAKGEES